MYGCCFDSIQLTQIITLNWVQIPPAMEPPIPDRRPPAPPARPPRAPPAPPVKPPIIFPSPPPVLLPFDIHISGETQIFILFYSVHPEHCMKLFTLPSSESLRYARVRSSLRELQNNCKATTLT